MWHKKNNQLLTSNNQPNNLTTPNTNPVGGGIRGNKRLTHTNQLTLLTTLKHLSILSITTSLLLVLTINIYRTYSYTNTLTNAVENTNQTQPSNSTSTTCNPSNHNAPVCIGFGIVSSTGDDTTSQTNNLGFTIPDGGGIAVGYQTINVITNTYGGYTVTINISKENSNKVNIGNNLARENSDGSDYDSSRAAQILSL